MKKVTIFFVFILTLLFADQAEAAEMVESKIDLSQTVITIHGSVTNSTNIYDDKFATYSQLTGGGTSSYIQFKFSEPQHITAYELIASSYLKAQFFDSNDQMIANLNPTWQPGGAPVYETSNPNTTTLDLEDVSYIRVRNTYGLTSARRVNHFAVYTGIYAPNVPQNVSVEKEGDNARITWNAVEEATGYYVYRDGARVSELISGTSFAAPYVNNKQHSWQVTAFNGLESPFSPAVVKKFDNEPPPAPKLIAEALEEGEVIRLSFNKTAADVVSYKIYRDGELLTTTTNLTARVVAPYNVPHVYTVTAVDDSGNESEMSNAVEIAALLKKDTIPPEKPIGLKGEALEGYVKLTWTANTDDDLDGYYVYVNGARYGELIKDNQLNVYGLKGNTSYRFRVAAVDWSGNTSMSDEITVKTLQPIDTTPPAAPRNLTAALAGNYLSILLSWGAVNESDVIGYYVYVSDDDMVYEQVNAVPVADTGFSFTQIEGNKTYYFKVAAVDASGNVSSQTNSVSIKVPTRDPNESVDKKNELLVRWNEIAGAVNYLIYFNGVLIATTDNQTFEFVIGEQYGYTGKPPAKVVVKARFEDGSIGFDKNLGTQSKWGFSAQDLWKTVLMLTVSLASLLLLSLAIRFAPRIFKLIKRAIAARRA